MENDAIDDGKSRNRLGLMIFIKLDIITKEEMIDLSHVLVN
jgi:hypothetical protein